MESLEALEHVASDVGLRKNGRAEVIGALALSEAAAGYNTHASLLKQLLHVEEVRFDTFGLKQGACKNPTPPGIRTFALATAFGGK